MNNLMKYYVTETEIIYIINGNRQGLVSVPKDLKDDIKVFLIFKDSSLQVLQPQDRNKLISEMLEISKKINIDENDGIFIVTFLEDELLKTENAFTYYKEFGDIKRLVNVIYNKLLADGNLTKEDFIKKVELISADNRYNSFINWICMQSPSKFSTISYQQLLKKYDITSNSDIFINQNAASIFNEPTKQSTMIRMQSNIKPINHSLSIGTPQNIESQIDKRYVKSKTLVKELPNNHNNHGSAAFIKWYTALFILLAALIIGFCISIVLVK